MTPDQRAFTAAWLAPMQGQSSPQAPGELSRPDYRTDGNLGKAPIASGGCEQPGMTAAARG